MEGNSDALMPHLRINTSASVWTHWHTYRYRNWNYWNSNLWIKNSLQGRNQFRKISCKRGYLGSMHEFLVHWCRERKACSHIRRIQARKSGITHFNCTAFRGLVSSCVRRFGNFSSCFFSCLHHVSKYKLHFNN